MSVVVMGTENEASLPPSAINIRLIQPVLQSALNRISILPEKIMQTCDRNMTGHGVSDKLASRKN